MPPSHVDLNRFQVNSLLPLLILKLIWIFEVGDNLFVWIQNDWYRGNYLGIFKRTYRRKTVSFPEPDGFQKLTDILSILSAIGSGCILGRVTRTKLWIGTTRWKMTVVILRVVKWRTMVAILSEDGAVEELLERP
jgi:hypothetical protein